MDHDDRYLNKTQAAAFFGVSVRSIDNWLRAGRLPTPEVLPNGRSYWKLSVLRACISMAPDRAQAAA